jgi:uncharacterized protein YodC (DUF2158 family)
MNYLPFSHDFEKPADKIQIGSIVISKIGGARRIVTGVAESGDLIAEWSDIENPESRSEYPAACLLLIE